MTSRKSIYKVYLFLKNWQLQKHVDKRGKNLIQISLNLSFAGPYFQKERRTDAACYCTSLALLLRYCVLIFTDDFIVGSLCALQQHVYTVRTAACYCPIISFENSEQKGKKKSIMKLEIVILTSAVRTILRGEKKHGLLVFSTWINRLFFLHGKIEFWHHL